MVIAVAYLSWAKPSIFIFPVAKLQGTPLLTISLPYTGFHNWHSCHNVVLPILNKGLLGRYYGWDHVCILRLSKRNHCFQLSLLDHLLWEKPVSCHDVTPQLCWEAQWLGTESSHQQSWIGENFLPWKNLQKTADQLTPDCNFLKDPEPEQPSKAAPKFWPNKTEIINDYWCFWLFFFKFCGNLLCNYKKTPTHNIWVSTS